MSYAKPYREKGSAPQSRRQPRSSASPTPFAATAPLSHSAQQLQTTGANTAPKVVNSDPISHFLQRELRASRAATASANNGSNAAGHLNTSVHGNGSSRSAYHSGDGNAPLPLSRGDVHSALEAILARQNTDWNSRRYHVMEQRERAMAHARRRRPHSHPTPPSPKPPPDASGDVSAVELLHALLHVSRERWQAHLSARVLALKREVCAVPPPEKAAADGRWGEPPDEGGSESGAEDVAWSMDQLYAALVDGLNSAATAARIALDGRDGIDAFGLLTAFRPPLQSLLARHEALLPSLRSLRRAFAALRPAETSAPSPAASAHMRDSAETAGANVEALLRRGGTPAGVAAALRGAVCPALRRLLYARALQLPLVATDGNSLFGGRGELRGNRPSDRIAGGLSFATKYCRDKVRRRMHHSYSTRDQEATAKLLQAAIKVDTVQYVGDSDKYFIFADDTEILTLALVVDRSLPDVRLRGALQQLGYTADVLDAYLVFLNSAHAADATGTESHPIGATERRREEEEEAVPMRAPPCGFFPVSGCSLLAAPICYITGDTVEQYELLAALFGQLWGRLQGPTPELAQCCFIFESLIARFAARACLHAFRVLQMPPLRLALQWMLTGFVEVLPPAELLSFWDLILSYHVEEMFAERTPLTAPMKASASSSVASPDTSKEAADGTHSDSIAEGTTDREEKEPMTTTPCALWLLPLLAASLFIYRAPLVERCGNADEMLLIFQEGHHVQCLPLLQYLLFMAK